MTISLRYDRQVLELVKNNDHFVLAYPNSDTGRAAAKEAVADWLIDCELDFDRRDADTFRKAIDATPASMSSGVQRSGRTDKSRLQDANAGNWRLAFPSRIP